MEITLDNILNIAGIFLGGGGIGAFFTWRYARREAAAKVKEKEAEAKEKEAEAKSAEVEMAQKVQDTYQEMLTDKQKEVEDNHRLIDELRLDRDHYKQNYIEMRDVVEKLEKEFREFRTTTEDERSSMKRDIARNGRQLECLRPFLCGRQGCKERINVVISDDGEVETPSKKTKSNKNSTFPTPYGEVDK